MIASFRSAEYKSVPSTASNGAAVSGGGNGLACAAAFSATAAGRFCAAIGGGTVAALTAIGTAAEERSFDIYWIDVEGGAATLLIAPSGESLLYDAGWENDDRDARRIYATAQAAGVRRIDYFVLSHFHADHAGGMVALAKLMRFDCCYDRGDFM